MIENLSEAIETHKPFLDNKYTKWYLSIISKESDEDYVEIHHILPRSLFPQYDKSKWNLVKLSAKQHFIVHMLLFRMFEYKSESYLKMLSAVNIMSSRRKYFNSRLYEFARLRWSDVQKNSKLSEEHKQNISKALRGTKRNSLTEEHKRKVSETKKLNPTGTGKWMHKEGIEKKVKLVEVAFYTSQGWSLGRTGNHITKEYRNTLSQRTNNYWKKVKSTGHTGNLIKINGENQCL